MRPIQFILIPLLLFWLLLFWVRLRRQPLMRALSSLVLGTALVFTLFPDSSTWVAHTLGVGRGVDVVIYLGMIGLTVGSILLYLRVLHLERKLAEVARELALLQAQPPADPPKSSAN